MINLVSRIGMSEAGWVERAEKRFQTMVSVMVGRMGGAWKRDRAHGQFRSEC
jgi:hypothetical protein